MPILVLMSINVWHCVFQNTTNETAKVEKAVTVLTHHKLHKKKQEQGEQWYREERSYQNIHHPNLLHHNGDMHRHNILLLDSHIVRDAQSRPFLSQTCTLSLWPARYIIATSAPSQNQTPTPQ